MATSSNESTFQTESERSRDLRTLIYTAVERSLNAAQRIQSYNREEIEGSTRLIDISRINKAFGIMLTNVGLVAQKVKEIEVFHQEAQKARDEATELLRNARLATTTTTIRAPRERGTFENVEALKAQIEKLQRQLQIRTESTENVRAPREELIHVVRNQCEDTEEQSEANVARLSIEEQLDNMRSPPHKRQRFHQHSTALAESSLRPTGSFMSTGNLMSTGSFMSPMAYDVQFTRRLREQLKGKGREETQAQEIERQAVDTIAESQNIVEPGQALTLLNQTTQRGGTRYPTAKALTSIVLPFDDSDPRYVQFSEVFKANMSNQSEESQDNLLSRLAENGEKECVIQKVRRSGPSKKKAFSKMARCNFDKPHVCVWLDHLRPPVDLGDGVAQKYQAFVRS